MTADQKYTLLVARKVETGEIKYFISNAAAGVPLHDPLTAAFARRHIELFLRGSGQGFERAKQEAGLGAFEVRILRCVRGQAYRSLLRHWLCTGKMPVPLAPGDSFAAQDKVFPGRSNPAASGGKISGSRWSKWRKRPTLWRGRCGSEPGAHRMKSPNDASTTKPATTLPMKAENEKPSAGRETQKSHSAVMLVLRTAVYPSGMAACHRMLP